MRTYSPPSGPGAIRTEWSEFSRADARTGSLADAGSGGSDGDAVVAPLGRALGDGVVDVAGDADADGLVALGVGLAEGAQAATSKPRKAVAVTRGIEVRIQVSPGGDCGGETS